MQKHKPHKLKRSMIAISLTAALLQTGCASSLPESKPCPPLIIPALSENAQTPPLIAECLPSCLQNQTAAQQSMLDILTNSGSD